MGATNPPTCTAIPTGTCHASWTLCVDGTDTGCLTCAAGKKFYKGKCETPCPTATYQTTDTCEGNLLKGENGEIIFLLDCYAGCSSCVDGTSCASCGDGFYPNSGACSRNFTR